MADDLLGGIPLFAKLTDAERQDLQQMLRPRQFEPNAAVFWVGEEGDDFFIVQSGRVVISCPDENGQDVTLATLDRGQFFGEISLLDGGRRTATARAQTRLTLLLLGREAFHDFVMHHPSSAIHMLTVLGRRQRETVEKLRGLRNANEAVQEQLTPIQRLFQRIAAVGASEAFLLANVLFFIGWILFHSLRYLTARRETPAKLAPLSFIDTPPTFFWLGFMITVEAIVLSMFVLNSQKRQAERDAIKADLDYQVNRKAHKEIMELHEKIDALNASVAKLTDAARPPQV